MTQGRKYEITKRIKLHTKPLYVGEIVQKGTFVQETEHHYFFDRFRVRKANIIRIREV